MHGDHRSPPAGMPTYDPWRSKASNVDLFVLTDAKPPSSVDWRFRPSEFFDENSQIYGPIRIESAFHTDILLRVADL